MSMPQCWELYQASLTKDRPMPNQVQDWVSNVALPKWPLLVVVGTKVTREQAAEIIIRTDSLYLMTNDDAWAAEVYELLGVPYNGRRMGLEKEGYDALQKIREELKTLDVEYLRNEQIASAYIGGPHGWCSWGGQILAGNFNIGKWPSADTVLKEWQTIAAAFPFLKLRSQLWSGENVEEDKRPIIEFIVSDGKAHAVDPAGPLMDLSTFPGMEFEFLRPGGERGTSYDVLKWALKVTREAVSKAS